MAWRSAVRNTGSPRRPRICSNNPDSRSGHDISVSVDLDPGFDSTLVQSVSHQINVRRLSDGRQRAELATGVTIPNKDFILEVQSAESKQPKVSLFLSPATDTGETHFLLAAFPPSVPPKWGTPTGDWEKYCIHVGIPLR